MADGRRTELIHLLVQRAQTWMPEPVDLAAARSNCAFAAEVLIALRLRR